MSQSTVSIKGIGKMTPLSFGDSVDFEFFLNHYVEDDVSWHTTNRTVTKTSLEIATSVGFYTMIYVDKRLPGLWSWLNSKLVSLVRCITSCSMMSQLTETWPANLLKIGVQVSWIT